LIFWCEYSKTDKASQPARSLDGDLDQIVSKLEVNM